MRAVAATAAAVLVGALASAWAVAGAGPSPADFRYVAAVEGTFAPDVPAAIPLPREVISRAAAGCADLRLFDDLGREVPYVIHEDARRPAPAVRFALTPMAYDRAGEDESFTYARPPQTPGPIHALSLTTEARDFKRHARILAGPSAGGPWTEVAEDVIFDFSASVALRKTRLELRPTEAPFLRLVLRPGAATTPELPALQLRYQGLEFTAGGGAPRFRIDALQAEGGSADAGARALEIHVVDRPAARREEGGSDSLIDLGPMNLAPVEIHLEIATPYYHRELRLEGASARPQSSWESLGAGPIYRIPGMAGAQDRLALPGRQAYALRLRIVNRDNPPLDVRRVELSWVRRVLYFIPAAARRYALYLGAARDLGAPDYETRRVIPAEPEVLSGYPRLAAGPIAEHPGFRPPSPPRDAERERYAFIVLVLAIVLAMLWWLGRILRGLARPGSKAPPADS